MARVFFGILPPKSVIADLKRLRGGPEHMCWQEDQQLHITVCYVGNLSDSQLKRIVTDLGDIEVPSFSVHFQGVDVFDGPKDTAYLWTGVEPDSPIRSLHENVKNMLESLGIVPEHARYMPHLTVARFDGSRPDGMMQYLARNRKFCSSKFEVGQIWLCLSEPGRYSSSYQYFRSFPLL